MPERNELLAGGRGTAGSIDELEAGARGVEDTKELLVKERDTGVSDEGRDVGVM